MKIKIEPIYKGKKVFIIGGGPSINGIDFEPIKSYPVIGTNTAYTLGTWIDICVFIDGRFYRWNQPDIDNWPNRIITCDPNFENHLKVEYLKKCTEHHMCWNPNKLPCPENGKNVGSTAIALAAKLGAKQIILLGYDMQVKKGRHNYHNKHKHTPKDDVYNKFMKHFIPLASELKNTNIDVVNATPNSKLDLFRKEKLENLI